MPRGLGATRVGVISHRDPTRITCTRCGREREINRRGVGEYCQDCRYSDPEYHRMVKDGLYEEGQ